MDMGPQARSGGLGRVHEGEDYQIDLLSLPLPRNVQNLARERGWV